MRYILLPVVVLLLSRIAHADFLVVDSFSSQLSTTASVTDHAETVWNAPSVHQADATSLSGTSTVSDPQSDFATTSGLLNLTQNAGSAQASWSLLLAPFQPITLGLGGGIAAETTDSVSASIVVHDDAGIPLQARVIGYAGSSDSINAASYVQIGGVTFRDRPSFDQYVDLGTSFQVNAGIETGISKQLSSSSSLLTGQADFYYSLIFYAASDANHTTELNLAFVPEPTSCATLGIIAMIVRRRRRR
jgi:hypothetical protein